MAAMCLPAIRATAGWAASPRTGRAILCWDIRFPARISSRPLVMLAGWRGIPGDPARKGRMFSFTGGRPLSRASRAGAITSSINVNPIDDYCTFWYTQQYSEGGWNWATRIVSFKMPACIQRPKGVLTGTVLDQGGHPIEGALVTAGTFTASSGADGTYLFPSLPGGTYTFRRPLDTIRSLSRILSSTMA